MSSSGHRPSFQSAHAFIINTSCNVLACESLADVLLKVSAHPYLLLLDLLSEVDSTVTVAVVSEQCLTFTLQKVRQYRYGQNGGSLEKASIPSVLCREWTITWSLSLHPMHDRADGALMFPAAVLCGVERASSVGQADGGG